MKKIAVLLTICLCSILSCGQPMKTTFAGENNAMDNEQLLLEKEKKTQVEEKKHTANDWTVELTSKLVELVSPKNNIINTVLFQQNIKKGTPYNPSFKVIKTISENNEISFMLEATIITVNNINIFENTAISVKFSDDDIYMFNAAITYKPYKELEDYVHTIKCTTFIDITTINKWRLYKEDATVILNTSNTPYDFILPQIFIQYLNEI